MTLQNTFKSRWSFRKENRIVHPNSIQKSIEAKKRETFLRGISRREKLNLQPYLGRSPSASSEVDILSWDALNSALRRGIDATFTQRKGTTLAHST